MNNEEIKSLINTLAFKVLAKSIGISILVFVILVSIIDGVMNDQLGEFVYKANSLLYYLLVDNKAAVFLITYIIILLITSFFIIRKTYKNLLKITKTIDDIIKNPEQKVELPEELYILESKLESIRADIINNMDKARDAESKKNELIMYMAHDLKTPLTSVIGYLTLINDEKNINQSLKNKYINIALDKAIRVEDLTNQFFEITRYNLHDMAIEKKKIDISLLLDQLIVEVYPLLQEKSLKILVDKPSSIKFMADGDKIARCFGNLLKNAIDYSYNNTKIEISMNEKKETIEIVFKNKGDKIPEYKLERIFEKFYRVDESRHSTGGTGLGLAIAKEIVELHNGTINVKNEDEYIIFTVIFNKKEVSNTINKDK